MSKIWSFLMFLLMRIRSSIIWVTPPPLESLMNHFPLPKVMWYVHFRLHASSTFFYFGKFLKKVSRWSMLLFNLNLYLPCPYLTFYHGSGLTFKLDVEVSIYHVWYIFAYHVFTMARDYGRPCILSCIWCFVTNDSHDHLYKISHQKQCIVGSTRYLFFVRSNR